MRKVSVYKCPHCNIKFKTLGGWNSHIEQLHYDKIPKGFTTSQYFYLILTGIGLDGPLCPICKERTPWNENTLKYARMCGKESCRKKAAEIAKKNMMKKYGKQHLLNDPDVQKKMLKRRRISGQYEFSDGTKFDYTGSYEKDFLTMLNDFLDWPSADLISPSPNVYKYNYQNKEHFYIPDFYIPSLNLEIEIKDGGDNPNNHWKIQAVDKIKEMEKDKVLNSKSDVNYIKVLNKDNSSFFEYLIKLKEENMGATESFITNCCPIVPYQGIIRDFDMEHDNDIENLIERSISRFNENKYDELITNESFIFPDVDVKYNTNEFYRGECDILFIGGYRGSGLSSIGKQIAKEFNAKYIDFNIMSEEVKNKFVKDKITGYISERDLNRKLILELKNKYDKLVIESDKIVDKKVFPVEIMKNYSCLIKSNGYLTPIRPMSKLNKDFYFESYKFKEFIYYLDNFIIKSHKNSKLKANESFNLLEVDFDKIVEFNKKLNNMEYIVPFLDEPGNITADGYLNYYKMLTPKEFEKYNGGVCWDYVAYEAWYFKKYFPNVKFNSYYAINIDNYNNPTHTFIIFEYDGYYYYFESSWKHNHGIFKFEKEKDALMYALKKINDFYFKQNKNISENYIGLYIAQYNPLDKKLFGMSCKEYMEYMSNLIKGPIKLSKAKEPIEIFTEPLLYENKPYKRK